MRTGARPLDDGGMLPGLALALWDGLTDVGPVAELRAE